MHCDLGPCPCLYIAKINSLWNCFFEMLLFNLYFNEPVAIHHCCVWLLFKSNPKFCNSSTSHLRELHVGLSLTFISLLFCFFWVFFLYLFCYFSRAQAWWRSQVNTVNVVYLLTCHQYVVFNKKTMGWVSTAAFDGCKAHFIIATLELDKQPRQGVCTKAWSIFELQPLFCTGPPFSEAQNQPVLSELCDCLISPNAEYPPSRCFPGLSWNRLQLLFWMVFLQSLMPHQHYSLLLLTSYWL